MADGLQPRLQAARRGAGGRRLSRRAFVASAGLAAAGATAAGLASRGGGGGGASVAGGGRPSGDGRRNVVLIVIDTLRPDHLGCYGNRTVRTPAIDALAREGVRFTRVLPEAMPTVPARRSILTGRRAFPFEGWRPWFGMAKRPGWQPIMPGTRTLVTEMRRAGYWTSYVSDNPFLTVAEAFEPFRATPDRYVRIPGQRGERRPASTVPPARAARHLPAALRDEEHIWQIQRYLANNGGGVDESETAAARVFSAAERQLRRPPREPFLMVVDSFDPHEPWAPPRRYLDLYGDPDYRGPEVATLQYRRPGYLSEDELERMRATYKASVTLVDRWLGRFLDSLDRSGLADSTAVALVSDHGILLGEHGWVGKGDFRLHPQLIHVPLLIRHPEGRGAGTSSDYRATTIDLAPTLMSLAGVDPPELFEGEDLGPILEGGEPARARPFSYGGYSNYFFADDGGWKLIARNDGAEHKLYDLASDPAELDDVADANPDVVRRLSRAVEREIGGPPPFYERRQLEARPRRLRRGRPRRSRRAAG